MVLEVSRSKTSSERFEILISRLKIPGAVRVSSPTNLDFEILVSHLQDQEQGIGFDKITQVLYRDRDDKNDISYKRINGQLSFETTIQKQFDMGYPAFKLTCCPVEGMNPYLFAARSTADRISTVVRFRPGQLSSSEPS